MKILTGQLKGRVLPFKPHPKLRPTADKTRKAVFDMLGDFPLEKNVLDLFSGTGALGIEALSGGAAAVTFVEKDRGQCERIRQTAEALGMKDRCRVLAAEADRAVILLEKEGAFFDLVLMDPPYDASLGEETLAALGRGALLCENAFVVFESRRGENAPERVGVLKRIKLKLYGDSQVAVYARR